jgi:hypothetical protein
MRFPNLTSKMAERTSTIRFPLCNLKTSDRGMVYLEITLLEDTFRCDGRFPVFLLC